MRSRILALKIKLESESCNNNSLLGQTFNAPPVTLLSGLTLNRVGIPQRVRGVTVPPLREKKPGAKRLRVLAPGVLGKLSGRAINEDRFWSRFR